MVLLGLLRSNEEIPLSCGGLEDEGVDGEAVREQIERDLALSERVGRKHPWELSVARVGQRGVKWREVAVRGQEEKRRSGRSESDEIREIHSFISTARVDFSVGRGWERRAVASVPISTRSRSN